MDYLKDEFKGKRIGTTPYGATYEILEQIGVLDANRNGISLELNRISFDGRKPVIDIRRWSCDKEGNRTMRGGISLRDAEVEALKKILWG